MAEDNRTRSSRGIFPDADFLVSEPRRVSFEIACAVVRYASEHNLGRRIDPEDVEATVRAVVWDPSYVPVRHREEPPRAHD